MHHELEQPAEELERVGGGRGVLGLRVEQPEHARERAAQHGRVLRVLIGDGHERGRDAARARQQHGVGHVGECALEEREDAGEDGRVGLALRLQARHERAQVGDRRRRDGLRDENLLDGGEHDVLVQELGRGRGGVDADVGVEVGRGGGHGRAREDRRHGSEDGSDVERATVLLCDGESTSTKLRPLCPA